MAAENGREYLLHVTETLKHRITQLDDSIEAGQKEIEGMHEYYWENYTEMDQYGYENFDNQQALLPPKKFRRPAPRSFIKLTPEITSPNTIPLYSRIALPSTDGVVVMIMVKSSRFCHFSWTLQDYFRKHAPECLLQNYTRKRNRCIE